MRSETPDIWSETLGFQNSTKATIFINFLSTLSFKFQGRLVSDPNLPDWHIVEVEVFGPTNSLGNQFAVKTVRSNPADPGAVTGSATYNSFLSSIIRAQGKGSGVHLC